MIYLECYLLIGCYFTLNVVRHFTNESKGNKLLIILSYLTLWPIMSQIPELLLAIGILIKYIAMAYYLRLVCCYWRLVNWYLNVRINR